MATHGLIIVETKADNELALSLLVSFKYVNKVKICFKEKKSSKEKVYYGRSWIPDLRHELIIFITFAHEILLLDVVCSW